MDTPSTIARPWFPAHGPIDCRRCFSAPGPVLDGGAWRAVNDPGAWGSDDPEILVLGFSKGFTQADAARGGRFEDIPFKGMRPRLTEILRTLGVLDPAEHVDARMVAGERRLAFGSLVRCSLSRLNPAKQAHECTGSIMPKAFVEREAAPIVQRCAETYLRDLPPSLKLVLMLGTGDAYIEGCRQTIRTLHGREFRDVNEVAYRTGPVTWVHVSHPSGLNGHHTAWMQGDASEKQGRKHRLALEAIRDVETPLEVRTATSQMTAPPLAAPGGEPKQALLSVCTRAPGAITSAAGSKIERVRAGGERYLPHRFRDGLYRVADPVLGNVKHHSKNQIPVRDDEIADYLRRGFLLRMRGEESGQVNLIAASEITF